MRSHHPDVIAKNVVCLSFSPSNCVYHEHIEQCKLQWRSLSVNAAKWLRQKILNAFVFLINCNVIDSHWTFESCLQLRLKMRPNFDTAIYDMHLRPRKGKRKRAYTEIFLRDWSAGQNQISISLQGNTTFCSDRLLLSQTFSLFKWVNVFFLITTLRSLYLRSCEKHPNKLQISSDVTKVAKKRKSKTCSQLF